MWTVERWLTEYALKHETQGKKGKKRRLSSTASASYARVAVVAIMFLARENL
jgi:hypothetical protein